MDESQNVGMKQKLATQIIASLQEPVTMISNHNKCEGGWVSNVCPGKGA